MSLGTKCVSMLNGWLGHQRDLNYAQVTMVEYAYSCFVSLRKEMLLTICRASSRLIVPRSQLRTNN